MLLNFKKSPTLIAATTVIAIMVAASQCQAQLINFDFERDSFTPNIPVHSGAAAIGSPGDQWNFGEPEFVQTFPNLFDSGGNPTSVQLDTDNNLGSFSSTNADFGTPLNDLMRDYAFTNPSLNGAVSNSTISGLPLNSTYTLYLYGVSDSASQDATFTVAGSNEGTIPVTSPDLNGPLTEGDDYAVFTGNTGNGSIDITVDGNGFFSAWNGFQLDIGPPSTDPPIAPSLLSPGNGATDVSINTLLEWGPGAGATSYDVFLWETSGSQPVNPTASVTGLNYDPGGLGELTNYSWLVESVNANGSAASSTFTFETGETPNEQIINVDWGKGPGGSGTGASAIQTGAAVVGASGDFWNATDPEANVLTELENVLDANNNPTSIDVIWTDELNSSVNTVINFGSTGHNALMQDYGFTAGGTTATITLADLPADTDYTLYLYGVPDGDFQDTLFTVTGSAEGAQHVVAGNVGDDNGLATPDDYVVFTGNTGVNGEIVYTQTTFSGQQGGFSGHNGLQLVLDIAGGGLDGDFNGDGSVDLADYTIWRNNLGEVEDDTVLGGNGNGDGVVDSADYTFWKDNYGASSNPVVSTASVPESGTATVALIALLSAGILRRRKFAK